MMSSHLEVALQQRRDYNLLLAFVLRGGAIDDRTNGNSTTTTTSIINTPRCTSSNTDDDDNNNNKQKQKQKQRKKQKKKKQRKKGPQNDDKGNDIQQVSEGIPSENSKTSSIDCRVTNKKQRRAESSSTGGKQGECLRRIKREWKDAVKLGIAYDWQTMQTVTSKGRSPSGQMDDDDDDASASASASSATSNTFYQYNYVRLGPYGKNLLRWHFSVLGPSHSPFSEGIYHGRILLPKNYPMSPPRVQMLTPSGRFVPGEDICLSASNYHPETWTPRWTILSLIDALRLHMLTTPNEIGGIDATREKRMELAAQSRRWRAGSIDHGQMVQCGIFCEQSCSQSVETSIMPNTQQHQQIEEDTSIPVDCAVSSVSGSGMNLENNHKQLLFTDAKHLRKKRTLVQQVILFSLNTFMDVCKSPYFRICLIAFLILSQCLLHYGHS